MSDTLSTTITVEKAAWKEGATNGKAWKRWSVKDQDGTFYSTFDAALGDIAVGAQGRRAAITYTRDGDFNNLLTLIPDPNSEALDAIGFVRAQTQTGAPDWDMIGLHKTRCALWAAAIGSSREWTNAGEIREWVIAAEVDIFHRQPAEETSDLPF